MRGQILLVWSSPKWEQARIKTQKHHYRQNLPWGTSINFNLRIICWIGFIVHSTHLMHHPIGPFTKRMKRYLSNTFCTLYIDKLRVLLLHWKYKHAQNKCLCWIYEFNPPNYMYVVQFSASFCSSESLFPELCLVKDETRERGVFVQRLRS